MAETLEQRVSKAVGKSVDDETLWVRVHSADVDRLTAIAGYARRFTKNYKNLGRPLTDPERDLRCAVDGFFGDTNG